MHLCIWRICETFSLILCSSALQWASLVDTAGCVWSMPCRPQRLTWDLSWFLLYFRLTLIRRRLKWSSWRPSHRTRRCCWSTPSSSRELWATWTQVSFNPHSSNAAREFAKHRNVNHYESQECDCKSSGQRSQNTALYTWCMKKQLCCLSGNPVLFLIGASLSWNTCSTLYLVDTIRDISMFLFDPHGVWLVSDWPTTVWRCHSTRNTFLMLNSFNQSHID